MCNCRPTNGFHQYNCTVSRRMRSELREAGTPQRIDPTKRARAQTRSCGWFRHNWDNGDSTCGTGCETGTTRYTCKTCGRVKDVGGA